MAFFKTLFKRWGREFSGIIIDPAIVKAFESGTAFKKSKGSGAPGMDEIQVAHIIGGNVKCLHVLVRVRGSGG